MLDELDCRRLRNSYSKHGKEHRQLKMTTLLVLAVRVIAMSIEAQTKERHGQCTPATIESDHTDTEITETTDQSHFADRKHYANSFQHLLHRRSSSNNSSAWPAASRISTSKSASAKLKELEDLLEVLPIQYCNSANTKVEGFYVAKEPGNYVLVFGELVCGIVRRRHLFNSHLIELDNTFSRHTPKILSFSVTLVAASLLRSRPMSVDGSRDGVSGWLLKKKRKKLQGK